MKTSFKPFGVQKAFTLLCMLPLNIPKVLFRFISEKPTFMWSNVPGLKCRLDFAGYKQTGSFFFVAQIGNLKGGFSCLSMGDLMGLGIISDVNGLAHPEEFLETYVRILNESLDFCLKEFNKSNS